MSISGTTTAAADAYRSYLAPARLSVAVVPHGKGFSVDKSIMAKQFKGVDRSADWLKNETTFVEAEAGQEQRRCGQPPSEWWEQRWSEFRSHALPGDEV